MPYTPAGGAVPGVQPVPKKDCCEYTQKYCPAAGGAVVPGGGNVVVTAAVVVPAAAS